MYKILKTAAVLLLIFGLTLLLKPEHKLQIVDRSSFVAVSVDSDLIAGSRQEFAVYLFNPQGKAPSPENARRLDASLILADAKAKNSLTLRSDARQLSDGAYVVSFDIPDQISQKQATLEINCRESGNLIFRGQANIERSITLMVLPPPEVIYAGSWLNLRIAAICRKSGQGIFKVPIRAKLKLPGGQQIVNRIIHSDIDGTVVFTTHINNNAAGGIYSCEFSYGKEKVSVNLNIKSMSEKLRAREKTLQERVTNPLASLLKSDITTSEPQQYFFATSLRQQGISESLEEVTLEKNQIFLNYQCPNSNWRQIEVWQNGRVHYTSDLQLESGRISLSFKAPLLADIPVKLKLWQLNDNGISVCEQTFYRAGEQETPISMFFKKADALFGEKGSSILARRALASKGLLISNHEDKVRINNVSLIPDRLIEPVIPPPTEFNVIRETPERLLKSDSLQTPGRRFFLVDNELQLSRYKFSSIRIWHNPRRFLGSLIRSLSLERSNIAFLIASAKSET